VKHAALLGLLLASAGACGRNASVRETPSASSSTPVLAAPHASVDAAPARSERPPPTDVSFAWAFWTSDGALLGASDNELLRLPTSCTSPARKTLAVTTLLAQNGTDTFVVDSDGAFSLWNATTLERIAPIDHPAHGRGGAVAPGGARVALGGCKEIASDPKLMTSCGELYDGKTGVHLAGFVGTHDFEDLGFTADGKYLVARSMSAGLTIFDAATGKVVVARPGWRRMLEVHAWDHPDVAEVAGDELVVTHGDVLEHVDLSSGKTLGKTTVPGRTTAVYAPRSRRVVVFTGAAAKVRVWDVATHAFVRTFDVTKLVAKGANCTYCAVEVDDVDEDRLWMTSAYTDDRLSLRVGTGAIERVEKYESRSGSVPSSTRRVQESYDGKARAATCALVRRAQGEPAQPLPVEYCNRTYGPARGGRTEWPYPGFDPTGRHLASIYLSELRVWNVERAETVCVAGKRGTR
jgi:hypothetical protein